MIRALYEWLYDRELVLAATWLGMSLFVVPGLLWEGIRRSKVRYGWGALVLLAVVTIPVVFSCYAAMTILDNVTCERITGNRLNDDGDCEP